MVTSESSWPLPVPPMTHSPSASATASCQPSNESMPRSSCTHSTNGSTPIIAMGVKSMMSIPRFSWRSGVVKNEFSVTRIV